jgi:hypothetical protein
VYVPVVIFLRATSKLFLRIARTVKQQNSAAHFGHRTSFRELEILYLCTCTAIEKFEKCTTARTAATNDNSRDAVSLAKFEKPLSPLLYIFIIIFSYFLTLYNCTGTLYCDYLKRCSPF